MLVHIIGAKCIGIDATKVTVEVDVSNGIGIHLVGLADVSVKESLLRTTTALQSLGYKIPGKRIVINLAPGDLHKQGSGYDLPIALGIIAATGQEEFKRLDDCLLMGELGLNGEIRNIPGALPYAEFAKKIGLHACILPVQSALEAVEFKGIDIYGVRSLMDVVKILKGDEDASDLLIWNEPEYKECISKPSSSTSAMDFADIIGQEGAKRGAEIAASGGHNLILMGSPGSGKSSLAKAFPSILPPMSLEESIVTSKIYSIVGHGFQRLGLVRQRPFRNPHYSASLPALIGGGGGEGGVCPGEISLAQNGVLFLDEFNLMPKSAIEALRAPMEDRMVTVSRLRSKVSYPASFILIAACNPCPCGYWGDGDRCTCTAMQRQNYFSRLSGPILDRIDLQVFLHPVQAEQMANGIKGESSASIAARVMKARARQLQRFKDEPISTNAEMNNKQLEKYCPLSEECLSTMSQLMERMQFSMRAYHRIIKVARTIADLEGCEQIETRHLLEASGYRFLDKTSVL